MYESITGCARGRPLLREWPPQARIELDVMWGRGVKKLMVDDGWGHEEVVNGLAIKEIESDAVHGLADE